MKTNSKKIKTEKAERTSKLLKAKPRNVLEQADAARAKRVAQGKQLMTELLPESGQAVRGSVVPKHRKAKAGKNGIWKEDAVRLAIKNAFLSEGSTKVEPKEAARIATDKILVENHLDAGRWSGKNPGMLAMNLGNVLRALIRNDGVAYVYGKKLS